MSRPKGYSEFLKVLSDDAGVRAGIMVDTSVLLSATNDADHFNEEATDFLELAIDERIPLYSNVTVRAEFLEQHRRLIIAEVLYTFASKADPSILPENLARRFRNWRKRAPSDDNPLPKLKLSEREIKDLKRDLLQITSKGEDVWSAICRETIKGKIGAAWRRAEEELGLNFLSTRSPSVAFVLDADPEWENTIMLMESLGIGSSDAMILNMFQGSSLRAIVTSDFEVAHAVSTFIPPKMCFVPDRML